MVIKLYLVTCYAENKPREKRTLPTWTDFTEEFSAESNSHTVYQESTVFYRNIRFIAETSYRAV